MAHKKSKSSNKKDKSKSHTDKKSKQNIYEIEDENLKKASEEVCGKNAIQEGLGNNCNDVNVNKNSNDVSSDANTQINPTQTAIESSTSISENNTCNDTHNAATETNVSTSTDLNELCEEIKAKQQEIFNRLKNLSDALAALTLIRDNVNSLTVDTLTEVYFTRQVRPLLDALNIIAFSSTNISATATAFQMSAFSEAKEIKNALKLSYKMNDEVDDIINALGRRLTIFLKQIDNMDKNCPPFDSN